MKYLFWGIAVLGFASILLVGSVERGDFEALQEAWEGPKGAIVASGLPPQIELIERVAGENGWLVDCTRQDGELTLVQLTPTFRAKFSDAEQAYSDISVLSTSSARLVRASGETEECGEGQSVSSSAVGEISEEFEKAGETLIAFGTQAELDSYIQIADECGLEGLNVRPLTQLEKEQLGVELQTERQGLSVQIANAGINQIQCYGVISWHRQSSG